MSEVVKGKCHHCKKVTVLKYCEKCDHWVCEACWPIVFRDGIKGAKKILGQKVKGCCGPLKPPKNLDKPTPRIPAPELVNQFLEENKISIQPVIQTVDQTVTGGMILRPGVIFTYKDGAEE